MPSGELIEAEAELVSFAVSEQILPGNFALLQAGHAAQHAAQRGLYAVGDLVVRRPGNDAGDKRAFLIAIGEIQIVGNAPLAANCPDPAAV